MKKNINNIMVKLFWGIFIAPLSIMIILLTLTGLGVFGSLPTFEQLESPKSNTASDLISDNGKLVGQYYIENRSFVDYNDLSSSLVNALISTEDRRYKSHSGIDYIGLARVGIKSIVLNRKQGGGSTISQQLAKNLFPRDLDSDDSKIIRNAKLVISKLKEWITAVKLEQGYTKEEIVVMYLNKVFYGSNAYGIKAAAQTFFNKHPSEVTVEEAALLIGVVNAPSLYNPISNPENAIKRRNTVILRMYDNDIITKEEMDSISAMPINLNVNLSTHNSGGATYFRSMLQQYMNAREPKRSSFFNKWDYEQELLLWESDPLYGWCNKNLKADGTKYNIYSDGLKIYTTINIDMQRYAEEAVTEHMSKEIQPAFRSEIASRRGEIFSNITQAEKDKIMWQAVRNSDRYKQMPDDIKENREAVMKEFKAKTKMRIFSYKEPVGIDTLMSPYDSIKYHKSIMRASFIAMEPGSGEVKAYVGGNDFRFFKYDMAKQGRRQVGSTIKPFIYTFAIDHLGISPCTAVPNLPVTVDGWTPNEDETDKLKGELRPLWWGLARSKNNYSTWIIKQSNYSAVADLIHKMGIRSFIDAVPSMCLGPSDISLYEMVGAYCSFVNLGVHVKPIFVTKIEDKNGNIISKFTTTSNEAISEMSAATMLSMMQKVTDIGGTGARVRWMYNITGEVAGKTGTTNDGSDGWFIGMTPKLVAGSWVGGENPSIHPSRDSEGSRLALPIFGLFMKKVYGDPSLNINTTDKFRRPAGYIPFNCKDLLSDEDVDKVEIEAEKEDFFQ